MRLLLAAVVLLVPLAVWGPLPASLGPVQGCRWGACQDQWTRGETTRVAFWGMPQGGQGLWQPRESLMHPVVGVGLTHSKLQRVHRWQGMGLLLDQNKQGFGCKALQDAFGTAAYAALSWFAGTCQLVRTPFFIGPLKRR